MRTLFYLFLLTVFTGCSSPPGLLPPPEANERIVLLGGNLCSRMMNYGHFETELHARYPDRQLFVRNMCDGGDTPGFRPHSGRMDPWAFPGAEAFQDEFAHASGSEGFLEKPDEWLKRLGPDLILAFFGYSESFEGEAGVDNFRAELNAWIDHTQEQAYNGEQSPRIVLVGPTAFEDYDGEYDTPDGETQNENLRTYNKVLSEVATEQGIEFLDLYDQTQEWFAGPDNKTIDGWQLTDDAYAQLAPYLTDRLFGTAGEAADDRDAIAAAVEDKNWHWHNDFKIPNGVHVFGRRYNPFGPDNYPAELEKIRQLTLIRDTAIWSAAQGTTYDMATADAQTRELPPVETNYNSGAVRYLYGEEALSSFTTAPGYKIELFASEQQFPDLANPCQLAFDNQGRLWVAVMPTYPHWRPGDPLPDDKLLILEDTDGDGKADKQTVWADGLHLPVGFEFAPEGVYVSQGTNLVLLTDTDGDDRADTKEIIMSGFDDHDTHHVISAFCADPSGAIIMGEGVFLHTNVETAYGTVRATNGGFYRYQPQLRHLERTAQIPIPNPWGTAFDDFGQYFFLETSGPAMRWMMPSTIQPRYGIGSPKVPELIQDDQRVRPTSGLEFVSSRHFPESAQGDILLNNTIGFLGTKQHTIEDDEVGYTSRFVQDLVQSTDPNFRPVDIEFAPDGSLYLVDWHNVLVGHMQHNARDPLRDHDHGRIYRITYPERPLVEPAEVAGADLATLFDNLKLPEARTRYRTRRELRGRDADEVLDAMQSWLNELDQDEADYERYKLEALWVSWGLNRVDQDLLTELLAAEDYRVRAGAVLVLRYVGHQVEDQARMLADAATDDHPRVRLTALVAASWLPEDEGKAAIQLAAAKGGLPDWAKEIERTALAHVSGRSLDEELPELASKALNDEAKAAYRLGHEIYNREGFCVTCHQEDGKGLSAANYPPIAETDWVNGDPEILAKIILNGLIGPIEVNGKTYPGQVPMTPYRGMLNDEEVRAVMIYVRNSFGNEAFEVSEDLVARVRAETEDKEGFWTAEELRPAGKK